MKKRAIPILIAGLLLFVASLVVLERSGFGVFLLIAAISAMIFGSVMLMGITGQRKASYFDNGRLNSTNTPVQKDEIRTETHSVWDAMEEKRD